MLDLYIQTLLLDHIFAREKLRVRLAYMLLLSLFSCVFLPLAMLLSEPDMEAIENQVELISEVFNYLEELAGTAEVEEWKELFESMDYTSREVVLELYREIKRQYQPTLIGRESCDYERHLFKAYPKHLPQSKDMDLCMVDAECNR